MKETKKYVLPGLGVIAGAAAAAVGVRAGYRWWRRRSARHRYVRNASIGGEMLFQPAVQMAGVDQEVSGGVTVIPEEFTPQAYRKPQMYVSQGTEPAAADATPVAQDQPVDHTEGMEAHAAGGQPASAGRSDDWAPAGGVTVIPEAFTPRDYRGNQPYVSPGSEQAAEQPAADATPVAQDQPAPVTLDSLAGPLIEYLIAFNSMMNVLRSQQATDEAEGRPEMTLGERAGMRNVLEQVEDRLSEIDMSGFSGGSLEDRTYRLAVRIRDALGNLDSTDSVFLRLYDDVLPEVCDLVRALQTSGGVSITGLDQVGQMYECRPRG